MVARKKKEKIKSEKTVYDEKIARERNGGGERERERDRQSVVYFDQCLGAASSHFL